MRFYNLFLLGAVTLLSGSAFPTLGNADNTEVAGFAFPEQLHGGRVTSEENGGAGKRFLRNHHTESKEKTATSEYTGDAEERGAWETLIKKAQLQYWFQRGKKPAWVRSQLGIPASGANAEGHKYYDLLKKYIKDNNGYKYHRFSDN